MTAIIYVNNEPFYCGNFNIELYKFKKTILIENKILLKIDTIAISSDHTEMYLFCLSNRNSYIIDSDILFNALYKLTPGKIRPVIVKNNAGEQISFLRS